MDSNQGSGAYACGVPIVALGPELSYGDTMKPGRRIAIAPDSSLVTASI